MFKEQSSSGNQPSLEHQLADARRALGEFTQNVVHDLHAPLRSVVNFSERLEKACAASLDERTRQYVVQITDSSRKAQTRLASILNYAQLESEPLLKEQADCNRLLYHALDSLKDTIEQRDAHIYRDPLPVLMADTKRISHLFYCLLSNALKFCTRTPDIHVSATRGPGVWIFSVRDNGIGIARKDQKNLFNVFHRLHREEDYPGAGMGLAIARRIIELHGGLIWVESSLTEGSTFFFTLPAAPTES